MLLVQGLQQDAGAEGELQHVEVMGQAAGGGGGEIIVVNSDEEVRL